MNERIPFGGYSAYENTLADRESVPDELTPRVDFSNGILKKMPTPEMLEAFLKGMSGKPTVIFNFRKGEFEWIKD